MKLVDADKARECFGGDGVTGAVMQRMFDSLPTIDAVPVVRCRDCKWFNHYTMECESDDVATDHEGGASRRGCRRNSRELSCVVSALEHL